MVEEGDLFLGTVERIEPTVVFVKLPNNHQGTIISSEIAPGRIKNMREYVMPNKKIVCKVLRVVGNHIDLSLRRVTSKEKNEVMQKFQQEQTFKSALNQILGKNAEKIQGEILKDFPTLYDFLLNVKRSPEKIARYIPEELIPQFKKVIEKKQKKAEVSHIIRLKCLESDGIKKIKQILSIENKEAKITYLAAGKFQIKVTAENYKEANPKIREFLESIEKSAKELKCDFESSEK